MTTEYEKTIVRHPWTKSPTPESHPDLFWNDEIRGDFDHKRVYWSADMVKWAEKNPQMTVKPKSKSVAKSLRMEASQGSHSDKRNMRRAGENLRRRREKQYIEGKKPVLVIRFKRRSLERFWVNLGAFSISLFRITEWDRFEKTEKSWWNCKIIASGRFIAQFRDEDLGAMFKRMEKTKLFHHTESASNMGLKGVFKKVYFMVPGHLALRSTMKRATQTNDASVSHMNGQWLWDIEFAESERPKPQYPSSTSMATGANASYEKQNPVEAMWQNSIWNKKDK